VSGLAIYNYYILSRWLSWFKRCTRSGGTSFSCLSSPSFSCLSSLEIGRICRYWNVFWRSTIISCCWTRNSHGIIAWTWPANGRLDQFDDGICQSHEPYLCQGIEHDVEQRVSGCCDPCRDKGKECQHSGTSTCVYKSLQSLPDHVYRRADRQLSKLSQISGMPPMLLDKANQQNQQNSGSDNSVREWRDQPSEGCEQLPRHKESDDHRSHPVLFEARIQVEVSQLISVTLVVVVVTHI